MKSTNVWRWLAGAFLLFLLWVAISADRGSLPFALRSLLYRIPRSDWAGHFILYGILAILGTRAFPASVRIFAWDIPWAMLVCLLLAALEELSQFWFPLRTPDWRDLGFGLVGILLGTWLTLRKQSS